MSCLVWIRASKWKSELPSASLILHAQGCVPGKGSLIEKVQNRLHSTGSHVANSFRAVYLNLYWQKVPRLSLKQKRQIMWSNLVHFFAEVCQVCCCSKQCFIVIHVVVVVLWSNWSKKKKKLTVKKLVYFIFQKLLLMPYRTTRKNIMFSSGL